MLQNSYNAVYLAWVGVMRGGKREGAGRKRLESSVVVRIPEGVLDEVLLLVSAYKQRVSLNDVTETKEETLIDSQPIKDMVSLNNVTEFKKVLVLNNETGFKQRLALDNEIELKHARKALERLKSSEKKAISKIHGSLFNAARDGVRAESNGFNIPNEFKQRYTDMGFLTK